MLQISGIPEHFNEAASLILLGLCPTISCSTRPIYLNSEFMGCHVGWMHEYFDTGMKSLCKIIQGVRFYKDKN